MNLFDYHKAKGLNNSELSVYNFILQHRDKVATMTIRELSTSINLSTTTIIRFAKKMGFDSYNDLKYALSRSEDKENKHRHYFPIGIPAIQFLQTSVQDEALKKQLSEIADLIVQAKQVIFLGVGTSLSLAEYGSYLFSGIGILSFAITNPFYSLKLHHSNLEDVLVIALSVSGETEEVLTLVQGFKERNAKIVSLTNTDISTLSQLSDINLSYFMPVAYADSSLRSTNLTTQIPVVYFLESLRYQKKKKK